MKKEEQLKLEYSILVEQYKAARDEINALLDASRQVVNLTLTAISLFLGVLAFVEAKLPVIFLVLPFFLYGLDWVQLRHILLMRRLSAYIAEALAPRIRGIIREISPKDRLDTSHILSWEEKWKSPGRNSRGLFLIPVLGASYGLPLFAAILSVSAYFFLTPTISYVEWILIAINVVAFFYSLVLGFLVEFLRFGQEYESTISIASEKRKK